MIVVDDKSVCGFAFSFCHPEFISGSEKEKVNEIGTI